jgi:hypothetical protein
LAYVKEGWPCARAEIEMMEYYVEVLLWVLIAVNIFWPTVFLKVLNLAS